MHSSIRITPECERIIRLAFQSAQTYCDWQEVYAYEQVSHHGTGDVHLGYALLMFYRPHLVLVRSVICCIWLVWYLVR